MASPDSAAKSAAASATSAAASAALAATAIDNVVETSREAVEGVTLEAKGYRDDAAAIVGLPTEAAAQAYNIENDPTVKSALSASYVGRGGTRTVDAAPAVAGSASIALASPRPHNAFPTLARRADGTLIAAFRGGAQHASTDGNIYTTVSSDDGATWGAASLVSTPDVAGAVDVRDPCITVLANGDVLLAWYDAGPRQTYFKRSTDGGATWGPSVPVDFGWTDLAFISAKIVQMASGTLLATAYGKNTGETWHGIRVVRSSDNGVTWGAPITVVAGNSPHFYEPNIQPLDGTNALMLIRNGDGKSIRKATTADDGITWTAQSYAFIGTGNPHMLRYTSGAVAVMYRALDHGGAVTRTSRDGGATWSRPSQFGESREQMTYADAVEVTAGRAVMVWASEDNPSKSNVVATSLSETPGLGRLGPEGGSLSPYALAQPVNEVWVPGIAFAPSAGSPAIGAPIANGARVLLFDPAVIEQAVITTHVPTWWQTFDVEIMCVPTATGGGLVKWEISHAQLSANATTGTGTYVSYGGVTLSNTVGAIAVGRILVDLPNAETTGGPWYFRVLRVASDAADTYAADAGLLGLRLIRKS